MWRRFGEEEEEEVKGETENGGRGALDMGPPPFPVF